METIPKFKVGERVRVMQTDEMVKDRLANLRGTIAEITGTSKEHGDACMVQFSEFKCPILIFSCSLVGVQE